MRGLPQRLRTTFPVSAKGCTAARRGSPALRVEELESRRLLSGGPMAYGMADVTYHGGPLLQKVQIESVYYGKAWATSPALQKQAGQLDGFLQYFVTSPYMDVLKQYNVSPGTFRGRDLVAQDPPGGQTLDDRQVRAVLDAEIADGHLAAPTADLLYVFFTAPGITVTANGQNSRDDFAGYHDTFTDSAGSAVYYAVVPYPTGDLATLELSDFQRQTLVLSHEVSEAVTDPDTQTGWFDPRRGEIGDLAEGTSGVLHGYVVQGVWSQADHRVVIPSDATTGTLRVAGTHVEATAGQPFTGVVATITGAPATAKAGDFTATIDWGNGTTSDGTITADPGGGFDVTGTNTYASAGWYPVTVTVHDQTGAVVGTALTRAGVAPPPPTVSARGNRVDATAGQPFSGVVATFTDVRPAATAADFTATIDWGDGTTSAGTVSADPKGGFDVTGTHTYATPASSGHGFPIAGYLGAPDDPFAKQFFVITVTIKDNPAGADATALSLAEVTPPPPAITATGTNIQATAGQPFSGVVATFTDVRPAATAADFTATIDWGDGTTSAGTVSADPKGGFDVTGTHTYAAGNSWLPPWLPFGRGSHNQFFVVHVTITDNQTKDRGDAESLATVAPAPPNLAVTAQNIQATAGKEFSGVVATFTDVNPQATAAGFTATIDWGDGTTSAGTVSADPKGSFDVTGTHTYADPGDSTSSWSGPGGRTFGPGATFVLTVAVKSVTGTDTGSSQSLARVTPPPANLQVSGTPINAVFGQPFSGTVATFASLTAGAAAAGFTATIDWGDGTTSAGTVSADPKGGFDVTGTHTYTDESDPGVGSDWGPGPGRFALPGPGRESFFVVVTVRQTADNHTATAVSLATVTPTPPKLVATGQTLPLTAGRAFTGTAATFTDADGDGAANFQATINWGDGTRTTGTVRADPTGGFDVSGTHTYAFGGTYVVFVTVRDTDGDAAVALGSAVVADTSPPASLPTVGEALVESAEYLADVITRDYLEYLSRSPAGAEVAAWVSFLQNGGTDEQVLAGFLGSAEFYRQAGNSDQAWVDALYHDLLGRGADVAGETQWLHAVAAGMSRDAIALGFATSQERLGMVVQNDYQRFLGRAATAAEVAGWVSGFAGGARDEQRAAGFLGSQEYYRKHNANASDWLAGAYQDLLTRKPDQSGLDSWLALLHAGDA